MKLTFTLETQPTRIQEFDGVSQYTIPGLSTTRYQPKVLEPRDYKKLVDAGNLG